MIGGTVGCGWGVRPEGCRSDLSLLSASRRTCRVISCGRGDLLDRVAPLKLRAPCGIGRRPRCFGAKGSA